MSKRRRISLTTKLACCLAELQMLRGDPFEWEALKSMSAAQVVSLYNFDHAQLHTLTANDAFWNLTPRLILDHRAKTKNDRRELRKNRKGGEAHKGHLTRMAEKLMAVDVTGGMDGGQSPERPKNRWPSRKMQSRPFPKRGANERRSRS